MPSNENDRCPGCGADLAPNPVVHGPGCPATGVTITDKRGKKQETTPEEREALDLVTDKLVALEGEGDQTYRQQRISELRAKGSSEEKLTAEEAGELLRLQAAEEQNLDEEAQVHPALTAFLVIIGHDGTATATHDVNLLMALDRLATIDDMDAGCAIVRRDIAASMTAKQVVFGLQVSAQAMGEKRAAVQAMQKLNLRR